MKRIAGASFLVAIVGLILITSCARQPEPARSGAKPEPSPPTGEKPTPPPPSATPSGNLGDGSAGSAGNGEPSTLSRATPPPRHRGARHPETLSASVTSAAQVRVFYATDRLPAAGSVVAYGGKRGDGSLRYGAFTVSIPRDHRLANIERPSIWRLEFREDPTKHFVIVSRIAEDEKDFYQEVSGTVAASEEKQAFVFIHGFNVRFDDAVYRTAQLAYDLGFSGAPILYSWPSNGEVQDYTWDATANDWSVVHLRGFLESLASHTGARTIHLIAHSMGNRVLVNALAGMQKPVLPQFKEIVLAAPDIDAGIFRELAAAVTSQASRVTLYASSNDRALIASEKINGGPRAGDAGQNIVVISGVDTIDVSALDTDFLGHSYYGDNKSVLTDLFALLSVGSPPDKRGGLHSAGVAPNLYWRFVL